MAEIKFYFHELCQLLFSVNLSLSDLANQTNPDFCALSLSFQSNCPSNGEAEITESLPAGGTDLDVRWNLFLVEREEVNIISSLK